MKSQHKEPTSLSTYCRSIIPPQPYPVEAAAGVFADNHRFSVDGSDCTLLLDATEEVAERTQVEHALRQTEEHLQQAERMGVLGRLDGGAAHDFNNLLTVILGYNHALSDSLTADRPRSAALEITQATEWAAAMTRHLLSFSCRQVRRLEVLDLNQVISRAFAVRRPMQICHQSGMRVNTS